MAVLRFKGRYIEPVVTGEKVQTLRAKVPGGVRPGVTVDAASSYSKPPWGRLRVDSIEKIAVVDLDDETARLDGFESAASLREELARLYPGVEDLFAIRFACVEPV